MLGLLMALAMTSYSDDGCKYYVCDHPSKKIHECEQVYDLEKMITRAMETGGIAVYDCISDRFIDDKIKNLEREK